LPKTKITETELIQILQTGSEEAFDILYQNYSAAIFGVIIRVVQNRELAEDITQETFIKIWNNFSAFDASKGKLYTWMLNIARNNSIDALRSKQEKMAQQNQELENSVYTIDQQNHSKMSEETIGLKSLVNQLPEEQREIVEKMYFLGYSQSEISKDFGIPLGTVKTRARQAISKLRTIFGHTKLGGNND
jgi:RNA polymerase sigma-70 factor, ECF subfamily